MRIGGGNPSGKYDPTIPVGEQRKAQTADMARRRQQTNRGDGEYVLWSGSHVSKKETYRAVGVADFEGFLFSHSFCDSESAVKPVGDVFASGTKPPAGYPKEVRIQYWTEVHGSGNYVVFTDPQFEKTYSMKVEDFVKAYPNLSAEPPRHG